MPQIRRIVSQKYQNRPMNAYARLTFAPIQVSVMDMGALSPLPTPSSLTALADAGPVSIFCDFDGTLVDIAPTPDSIEPRADLAEALAQLSDSLDGRLALVSGRSIDDIEKHLGSLPLAMAGSHGAAKRLANGSPLGQQPQGISADARAELRDFAEGVGASLEEKTHGAALHYRHNPELADEVNDFAENLAAMADLITKRGKCVIELVEPGANKGAAVDAFMDTAPFAGSLPWFIGDDVTDEDGFRACIAHGGGGILVGNRDKSCATHHLPTVNAVHQWLEIS